MTRQAPLLPGSPLVGSALELRADMLGMVERAFHEHGDVIRMRIGPPGIGREMMFVYHPDGVQHVLASHAGNYRKDNVFYGEVRDAFGNGLLTSQDDAWHRQKRFLQPLFTTRRVTGYATTMAEQVDAVVRRWRTEPAGVRDLHDEMTRLTLRIVCRVLFGNDLERALKVVQHRIGPLGEAVRARSMTPVRVPASWPTPTNRRLHRARRELFGVCDDIIAARRGGAGCGTDLLGMLLDARDGDAALSDTEIRDQVLIFLLAGHETTATALTYALDLLGRHPDVQAKVRDEVDAAGGAPTAALPYTTMVLKEAMRLFPSAPLTGRRSVADDEISGFAIPAGTDVSLVPWVTHRHPAHWDDPARFDPERFTPGREKGRHRYAWFPFGGGPRACIGQHFSMLESAIVVAGLVRAFDFTTEPGEPRYTNTITLRPVGAVPARIRPRRVTPA